MSQEQWADTISANRNIFSLKFKEIWRYRDLIVLFVKRDLTTVYKQTVLGPLWYVIQPLFTAIIFTVIFNYVAQVDTNGVPAYVFNLFGVVTWSYFSQCFVSTSDTFKSNENIFGKVYFPRAVIPISTIISLFIKFLVQFAIFISFYAYYLYDNTTEGIGLGSGAFLYIFSIISLGLLGLGLGMISSSLTTKYRDLIFLLNFGIQLLMYLSAVMYPMELIQKNLANYSYIVEYNPIAIILESSRNTFFYEGGLVEISNLAYPFIFSLMIFISGIAVFNKTEKSFIDTV